VTWKKKSILIVDDDEAILKVFKEILEFEHYVVDTAKTGREALEKSEKSIYDLALLDIRLPDIEGIDLLRKLHKSRPRMMKIMVTGYPTLENAIKSVNLGADAYLVKPVQPHEMVQVVQEKIQEQKEAESMSEKKVGEWIEARVQKLEEDYSKKTSGSKPK
jgi:DNA-binding NtrC family response regulator